MVGRENERCVGPERVPVRLELPGKREKLGGGAVRSGVDTRRFGLCLPAQDLRVALCAAFDLRGFPPRLRATPRSGFDDFSPELVPLLRPQYAHRSRETPARPPANAQRGELHPLLIDVAARGGEECVFERDVGSERTL